MRLKRTVKLAVTLTWTTWKMNFTTNDTLQARKFTPAAQYYQAQPFNCSSLRAGRA
jgi:hypothetical protein